MRQGVPAARSDAEVGEGEWLGQRVSGESFERSRLFAVRMVQRIVGCPEEARDVVEAVLERLARGPPREVGSLGAYLVKAAQREAARRRASAERERRAWQEACKGGSLGRQDGGGREVEQAATARWALREIRARLTGQEVRILDFIVAEWSEREIACLLGCTAHTIRRAKARIRRVWMEVLGWRGTRRRKAEAWKFRRKLPRKGALRSL